MSKKIISICLVFILSFALMVPVCFAANEHWYNVVNPVGIQGIYISNQTQISDYANLNSSGYWETNSRAVSSDYLTFGFNPNWTLSYSSAYDYWITWQCFAFMDNDISKFSFYPTDFDAEYYDIHTYQWKRYGLENVSFSHLDSYGKAGFSCFAKFPDNFNATIESISAYGSYGTVPANLISVVQIYQVPKNSDGSSQDTAQVIAAIQAQTETLAGLIQGNGGDPDAGAVNSELSAAIDDVDRVEQDIHMQAEEAFKASDSLIQSFDPEAFQSAGNLYKQLSQSAFDSLGLISVFILIPLILFCVGAFIGKLK